MTNFDQTAFVFPGQGSQTVGMGQDIANAYPVARQTFDHADDIMGFELSKIIFEGPTDELNDTAITQPAIYVCSMAILRALVTNLPNAHPACVAGHSLGEFTALTAAGAVSFEDGLALVRERGRLMKQAGDEHPGGMAAIIGMDTSEIYTICEEVSAEIGAPLVVANDNCPGQVVISGENEALARGIALAKERGARRAIPLAVSVATHSPLMTPAKETFNELVHKTNFSTPKIPVYGNVSATSLTSVAHIEEELREQLTNTVRWTESVQTMIDLGIETFVEIGPKKVLTGLLKYINRAKIGVAITDLSTLQTFLEANA
jgi:[acyl-carrier-protein] S-malonyltransferase